MNLTIIGSSAAYAPASRANASYLIREKETKVLVDAGNGSISRLFDVIDPAELDALIISHMHMDHFGDLYPLRFYLHFDKQKRLAVFLPKGGPKIISSILSPRSADVAKAAYDYRIIEEKSFVIGDLAFSFHKVCHLNPTYGLRISNGDKTLAYSADTKFCPEVIKLAKDADAFLCEATMPDAEHSLDHMNTIDAAIAAKESNCRRLILTHMWPTLDLETEKKKAEKVFGAKVEVALEGDVFEI